MKKKIVISVIAIFCIVVLIGGVTMMNKKVKQDEIDLSNINTVLVNADAADIRLFLTDGNKMTLTQYSKKSVDKSFGFTSSIDDHKLIIQDNSKEVNWLFGMKGSAGISYELQIPKSYNESMSIQINRGNVEYSGATGKKFKAFNVSVKDRGDIKLNSIGILQDSQFAMGNGNIDMSILDEVNCKVNAEANKGNVSINPRLND